MKTLKSLFVAILAIASMTVSAQIGPITTVPERYTYYKCGDETVVYYDRVDDVYVLSIQALKVQRYIKLDLGKTLKEAIGSLQNLKNAMLNDGSFTVQDYTFQVKEKRAVCVVEGDYGTYEHVLLVRSINVIVSEMLAPNSVELGPRQLTFLRSEAYTFGSRFIYISVDVPDYGYTGIEICIVTETEDAFRRYFGRQEENTIINERTLKNIIYGIQNKDHIHVIDWEGFSYKALGIKKPL